MKRLALFLDGTWNDPKDETNVHRLHLLTRQGAVGGGHEQRLYYAKGVGTRWNDRIIGGAFGAGLSRNVLDAYKWLLKEYDDGDEIYLFGFSRGAYTARSIAGLIAKCGLLKRGAALSAEQVYDRYQLGKEAVPIYRLEYLQRTGERPLAPDEQRLMADSRRVPVRMLGVWDTVGALGVPWNEAPLIGRRNFYFHNTNPSVLYQNAYHALAIDEHRAPYKPTLWTRFTPEAEQEAAPKPYPDTLEQRWFVGAHSNVGGGYKNDPLHRLPLAWMQEKARGCGLEFSSPVQLQGDEVDAEPTDSFARFMKGIYRIVRLGKRFHRPIGAQRRKVRGGWSTPLNEWVDASVFEKYRRHPSYRPVNLEEAMGELGMDCASIRESLRLKR